MQQEFKLSNNKKYDINGIYNNAIYAKKLVTRQLLGFYNLIL